MPFDAASCRARLDTQGEINARPLKKTLLSVMVRPRRAKRVPYLSYHFLPSDRPYKAKVLVQTFNLFVLAGSERPEEAKGWSWISRQHHSAILRPRSPLHQRLVPVFNRMLTLLASRLVAAKSSFPSPLRSPTATETGRAPTETSAAEMKVPSPAPNLMLTLFELEFAEAKSRVPSASKSPNATD